MSAYDVGNNPRLQWGVVEVPDVTGLPVAKLEKLFKRCDFFFMDGSWTKDKTPHEVVLVERYWTDHGMVCYLSQKVAFSAVCNLAQKYQVKCVTFVGFFGDGF